MVYKFNLATGKEENKMYWNKYFDSFLKPVFSYQGGEGSEIILFGQKHRKFQYGSLKF